MIKKLPPYLLLAGDRLNFTAKDHALRKIRQLRSTLLLCLTVCLVEPCIAQTKPSQLSLTPEQQRALATLAVTIQKELKKEKCEGLPCQVLVVNFTIPTGETCSACILVSDSLATTLATMLPTPLVISRDTLASFMDKERIPAHYLDRPEAFAWVASELRAKRLVFGTMVRKGDSLQLNAKVLKHENFGNSTQTSKNLRVEIPIGDLGEGFGARESYHALQKRDAPQFDADATEPDSFKRQGIEPPRCDYTPNPEYTDAARAVKFSGTLILEAIVTKEGTLAEARITRGLPYGLNQSSLKTLKNWKCRPATKSGVPLALLVPFEVAFRLD